MNQILSVDAATQAKFRADIHRPVFHFLPPMNWMNDPNGLIQWQGVYHLFYQHNPFEAKWGPMYWGHAVSRDLVHWEHRPIAMAPTPDSPDEDGCWSGCAVVNQGVPTMIYSGNRKGQQRACLAAASDDLDTLQKYAGNPVIAELPAGYDIYQYRDHCVWHDGQCWNQLIGAGIAEQGGTVFLYQSPDLLNWELRGPILTGNMNKEDPLWSGRMWECPDLIPVGEKHMLVVSAYSPGEIIYTGYFLGTYREGRFTPESYQKMDWGDREFYAPQSFRSEAGERIQLGWLPEARPVEACLAAGWAGVMSLPRVLSLRGDGRVGIRPHSQLEGLRGPGARWEDLHIRSAVQPLECAGRALELHVVLDAAATAQRCGLKILAAPDGSEETLIRFEPRTRRLAVIRERASLVEGCAREEKGGLVPLAQGEDLDLRIFIDHSVVEIFINGRETLSCRVYPSTAHATGVALFAEEGECLVRELEVWEMKAAAPAD